MTKVLAAILIVLTFWVQYHIWYGKKGQQKLSELQTKITEQKIYNLSLKKQNRALKHEIYLLRNNPSVLEEKAREQLGLIKDGEIFYRIIPSETEQK